ncbi:MAG: hypothetical protein FWF72_07430 [Paludibacter sp.]|nr:hypothetical protein [Paludibacter sp.]
MKNIFVLIIILTAFYSCSTMEMANAGYDNQGNSGKPVITQSLFTDKNATISEENIQKLLDGVYTLSDKMKIAVVRFADGKNNKQYFYWNYYNQRGNEEYLKTQQEFLELFTKKFNETGKVSEVFVVPDILLASNPSFTNIREAAVRTQSDVVAIFTITSELYTKRKIFSKLEIKAYSTIQFVLMDVRTGLIPFSTIVTKDFQAFRAKEETDFNKEEASERVKKQATLLSIEEIGQQLKTFLEKKRK